jgi:hypothetical protein
MALEPIISWKAQSHSHMHKGQDWYWAVGIITLAISVVCFIFGNVITGIFVIIASVALVVHASQPPKEVQYSINDRGIVSDDTLFPFLSLDSFWIDHTEETPRILIKSRRPLMPLIIIHIQEIDSEEIRQVLLRYIAETEHKEPLLKKILESFGF